MIASQYDLGQLLTEVKTELDEVVDWLNAHKLIIDYDQTRLMYFHTKNKP